MISNHCFMDSNFHILLNDVSHFQSLFLNQDNEDNQFWLISSHDVSSNLF